MALPRKRKKPRRTTTPRCSKQRCERPASIEGMCKTHAKREADRVFSLVVRGYGGCYGKTEFWSGPEFKCAGSLQCAHLISRRYHNTRWNKDNAVPLCAAHHKWLDTNPLEKDVMIEKWLGKALYKRLKDYAMRSDIDWHKHLLERLPSNPVAADTDL